jgi:hypothetical protein
VTNTTSADENGSGKEKKGTSDKAKWGMYALELTWFH